MCMSSAINLSMQGNKQGSKIWTSFCLAGVVFYMDQSSNNPPLLLFSTYSWKSLIQQRTSFSPASEQWIKEWENLILKQPGSYEYQRLSSRRCIPLFGCINHQNHLIIKERKPLCTIYTVHVAFIMHYLTLRLMA